MKLQSQKVINQAERLFDRVDELEKKGFYCEIIPWFASLFEMELIIYIVLVEDKIKIQGELDKNILANFKPQTMDDLAKGLTTLQPLIDKASKLGLKPSLVEELHNFKNTRNRIIHKYFYENVDVKKLDTSIKTNYLKKWRILAKNLGDQLKEASNLSKTARLKKRKS